MTIDPDEYDLRELRRIADDRRGERRSDDARADDRRSDDHRSDDGSKERRSDGLRTDERPDGDDRSDDRRLSRTNSERRRRARSDRRRLNGRDDDARGALRNGHDGGGRVGEFSRRGRIDDGSEEGHRDAGTTNDAGERHRTDSEERDRNSSDEQRRERYVDERRREGHSRADDRRRDGRAGRPQSPERGEPEAEVEDESDEVTVRPRNEAVRSRNRVARSRTGVVHSRDEVSRPRSGESDHARAHDEVVRADRLAKNLGFGGSAAADPIEKGRAEGTLPADDARARREGRGALREERAEERSRGARSPRDRSRRAQSEAAEDVGRFQFDTEVRERPRGRAGEALRTNQLEQLLVHETAAQGDGLSKPYLGGLPDAYVAERLVFDWLEFLVLKGGFKRTMDAIRYYHTVDWLTEDVEAELQDYLVGFSGEVRNTSEFDVDDHHLSLVYIARLASMA